MHQFPGPITEREAFLFAERRGWQTNPRAFAEFVERTAPTRGTWVCVMAFRDESGDEASRGEEQPVRFHGSLTVMADIGHGLEFMPPGTGFMSGPTFVFFRYVPQKRGGFPTAKKGGRFQANPNKPMFGRSAGQRPGGGKKRR
jgi:hypothetical protein